jgi:hypothetical protein
MARELLEEANRKRQLAVRMRRMAPDMARSEDRADILEHARRLETEAAALEAQAQAVNGQRPRSDFRQLLVIALVVIAALMVIQVASMVLENSATRSNVIANDEQLQLRPDQMQNVSKPTNGRTMIRAIAH